MMHLAELNIAELKHEFEDPKIAGFRNNLGRINTLARKMPGFVWMHQDDSGHAMEMETPWPNVIANMSVWQSAEQLENFVWNTVHKKFYARKQEWFEVATKHYFVMWWIEEGHQPTLLEAKERLDYLEENGDSDYAFTWSHLPHIKLWQSQQCG